MLSFLLRKAPQIYFIFLFSFKLNVLFFLYWNLPGSVLVNFLSSLLSVLFNDVLLFLTGFSSLANNPIAPSLPLSDDTYSIVFASHFHFDTYTKIHRVISTMKGHLYLPSMLYTHAHVMNEHTCTQSNVAACRERVTKTILILRIEEVWY